jgi:hypothetical protein
MLNAKELYVKLVKTHGKNIIFSHRELKNCLERQDGRCEVCSRRFSPFNGLPAILGRADSALCLNCVEGISLLGFCERNLARAILVSKKVTLE